MNTVKARTFIAIPLAVLLVACEEKYTPLTSAELSSLFGQDREISFARSRFSGTAMVYADKTFDVNVPLFWRDAGVWWLDRDRVCSRWEKLKRGRNICAVIGKLPNGTYVGLSPSRGARLGTFKFLN